jgi:hypothetical protein
MRTSGSISRTQDAVQHGHGVSPGYHRYRAAPTPTGPLHPFHSMSGKLYSKRSQSTQRLPGLRDVPRTHQEFATLDGPVGRPDGNAPEFPRVGHQRICLRIHVTPEPEPTLPPPEPLEQIEIKRIVEAMMNTPPPPVEQRERFRGFGLFSSCCCVCPVENVWWARGLGQVRPGPQAPVRPV